MQTEFLNPPTLCPTFGWSHVGPTPLLAGRPGIEMTKIKAAFTGEMTLVDFSDARRPPELFLFLLLLDGRVRLVQGFQIRRDVGVKALARVVVAFAFHPALLHHIQLVF